MSSRSRSDRAGTRVSVRRAVRADAGAIAGLARALNLHQRDPTRYFTKAAVLRDGFGRRPRFEVFLAEIAGRPVGYALVMPSYDTGWAEGGLYLQDLFVGEDARGFGVGRALIAAAAHESKRRGGYYVWCAAKTWNRAAQRFYRGTKAVEEPVLTYAWIRSDFARLAREGARRSAAARGRKARR